MRVKLQISTRVYRSCISAYLLLTGAGAFTAYSHTPDAYRFRATPKVVTTPKVVQVRRTNIVRSVVAAGLIEPVAKSIEIKSKASGIVKKIYGEVGDYVHAGQVLVELDRDDIQEKLRKAEARVTAARAEPVNASIIRQKQAKVEEALAVVNRLRTDLDNTTIRSPISAVILARGATGKTPGSSLEVGSAVFSIYATGEDATVVITLGDMSRVLLAGKISHADLAIVHVGQTAKVTVDAFPNRAFAGFVHKIGSIGFESDATASFEVRVLNSADQALRANMSATAEIASESRVSALTLPKKAIRHDKDGTAFVLVTDASGTEPPRRVDATVGIADGNRVEVLAGLEEGQAVLLP